MNKTVKITLLTIALVFIAIAATAFYGVYDYIQGAAKFEYINDSEEAIVVFTNREYSYDDFAIMVRGEDPKIGSFIWDDNTSDGAIISEDGSTITFEHSGSGVIGIYTLGERTEGRAIDVSVCVKEESL